MKQVLKTVTFGSFDRMVEYDRWIVPGQHCYTPRELKEMKEEVRNEPMMFFAEVAWASGLASMRSEKPLTSRDRTRLAIERCEEHTFKSKCTLKFNRANRDRLDALRKSRRSEYEVVVKAEGLRKERSEAVAVSQTSTCGSMRRKNRREQRQVDVLKREKSEDIAVTQISPPTS
ncbi:hypothetical protein IE53DRAFT_377568 [Violaceomyces palustris]|uniref:Uncharacterized protein n=1 Tax=Violaceomyces palustris TaxID=1673888 RepID=A0ACD0P521_9BASI|nr:hypothetical protein IE53DRAFT_377568 [Violaceomyces palustris]